MKVAFTGAPCTGKSTVFDKIVMPGYHKIPEVARFWLEWITDFPHYSDREFFQKLIEVNHLTNLTWFRTPDNLNENAIFDRTLPDEIAYRRYFDMPVPETLINDCKTYMIDKVFIFPFWEEIYKTDKVRVETAEEASQLDRLIIDAYIEVGYTPIIVPKTDIETRINFIVANINNGI